MGLQAGPWTDQNLSKTNFLGPGVIPGGSASKSCARQKSQNQNPSVDTGAMIDFGVQMLHPCPTNFWCKTAYGAKRITLRGTFCTNHLHSCCGDSLGRKSRHVVPTVSTSPPGGNRVDGSPPAASRISSLAQSCCFRAGVRTSPPSSTPSL